jgi:hypothetical protein
MMRNHWVQVTPDCACVFFLSQRAGALDPARSPMAARCREAFGVRAACCPFGRGLAFDSGSKLLILPLKYEG